MHPLLHFYLTVITKFDGDAGVIARSERLPRRKMVGKVAGGLLCAARHTVPPSNYFRGW
jgi:hypothetical protein